ncbi:alanine:cation symporter family protein [Synechococcus sp. ATX 2A4]|uniref:alanine/glycine:cation symporter family protein n=1 Tax=Synechococcus sp. ATX 2A4 TaxID=2823727 RepID=UPI0020CD931C|nr:alanine:cation symporter family protein [Synechococcus sp. ATX 2A4]MCP9884684.1 alanine:cation symporter family protein [Synechococcus sp. ATX 2A4]
MEVVAALHRFVWGLLADWVCFVAVFLCLGLNFGPWRLIPYGLRQLWSSLRNPGPAIGSAGQPGAADGELDSWTAFLVTLGGTVGIGNITGTAVAVTLGGPGVLAWLWAVSLVGMALKFADTALAVRFRRPQGDGSVLAGPMLTIQRGLHRRWRWLAVLFAAMTVLSAFGSANGLQVGQLAAVAAQDLGSPPLLTGLVTALATAAVLSGGLRRVGRLSAVLVPLMVLGYGLAMAVLLLEHAAVLPAALDQVLKGALSPGAIAGGGVAVTVNTAVRLAVFSSEAGTGSAAIVLAAARPADPLRQGSIAMLANLLDTALCTALGLLLIASGVAGGSAAGRGPLALVDAAMTWAGPGWLGVSHLAIVLFSFTTILSAGVVAERCVLFLGGNRWRLPYRCCWCGALVLLAPVGGGSLWLFAELVEALVVLPNLLSLLLLSPFLFQWFADQAPPLAPSPSPNP